MAKMCFDSLGLFITISTVILNQSHYARLSLPLSLSLSLSYTITNLQRAVHTLRLEDNIRKTKYISFAGLIDDKISFYSAKKSVSR